LYILGFARRDWSDEFLRETLREAVVSYARTQPISQPALERLLANAYYIRSTFEDLEGYHRLASLLKSLRIDHVLYYLATPPEEYVTIVRRIGEARLNKRGNGW